MAKKKKRGASLRGVTLTYEQASRAGVPNERADDIIRLGADAATRDDLAVVVESVGYYAEKADHLIEVGAVVSAAPPAGTVESDPVEQAG